MHRMVSTILLVPTLVASICGCRHCDLFFWETVKGNGTITQQWWSTDPFTALSLAIASTNVHLRCKVIIHPDSTGIQITTDKNLLPLLVVHTTDEGTLRVKSTPHYRLAPSQPIQIVVYTTDTLQRLELDGSITLQDTIPLSGNKTAVSIAGAGEGIVAIRAQKAVIDIAGSGELSIVGSARRCQIDIAGSGEIQAQRFETDSCWIDIAGAGSCAVAVQRYLSVDIAGSGEICYIGSPSIKKRILGSGDIHRCPKPTSTSK